MGTTEVRFKDLSIASTVAVGARALPSLSNDIINMVQVLPRRAFQGLRSSYISGMCLCLLL